MTDCPNGEMRDLLPDLLHDRLEPARRAEVEAHVAGCAECREELELLGLVRGTLRRSPAVDVPAIVAAVAPYRAPARRAWGGWRAAAAVAAIALGVGTTQRLVGDRASHVVTPAPAPVVAARPAAHPIDSAPVVAPRSAPAPTQRVAQAAPRRELAVGGTVADLTDAELAAVLADLESLDAMPAVSAESEGATLAPAPAVKTSGGML